MGVASGSVRYMLIPLENAAKALAVPFDNLYKALQSEHRALQYVNRVLKVRLEDAARVLGLSREDFLNIRAGREWLMSEKDIAASYGDLYLNDPLKFKRIAGSEVFSPAIGIPVYRASPFVKLAMMSAEDRAAFLEGITDGGAVGSGHETEGGAIRPGLKRSHKNRPTCRYRRRQSKRLGSGRPRN